MNTENKLTYIPVDKIIPHNDNPRKELGDLTELCESIKARGVMQNLTVCPCPARGEGMYVVIIGHRRLMAAKLAGLAEVPCVVTDMSHEEQLATMLLENLVRADLTPYEQAQGFQLLIDVGETVASVSEKTGFSRSTVRRRLEMAKLDQETLKRKSENAQISLSDLDRLSKIEDLDERNKVLKEIGTKNYDWALKKAIEDQEKRRGEALWTAALSRHGVTAVEYKHIHSSEYSNCEPSWVGVTEDPEEVLAKAGAEFATISNGYVYLRKKKTVEKAKEADPAAAERARRDEERRARVAALEEACKRAKECRMEWIRENGKRLHMKDRQVIDLLLDVFIDSEETELDCESFNSDTFLEVCGVKEYDSADPEKRHELRSISPAETLVRFAYACLEDNYNWKTYNSWWGTYEAVPAIKALYVFLGSLGYEPGDEEVALVYGTSELYAKEATE